MTTIIKDPYETLCQAVSVLPCDEIVTWKDFDDSTRLLNSTISSRITAALRVLFYLMEEDPISIVQIDRSAVDFYLEKIDRHMSVCMDAILHHPEFQKLETLWRSIEWVVTRVLPEDNCQCELLSVQLDELRDDFLLAENITQTGLYKHLYFDEYDTPGGEPFTAVITPFEFTAKQADIKLLEQLSTIAAATHCPVLASVGPAFFGKEDWDEVLAISDLSTYLERAEYIPWNRLRQLDTARYLGLMAPRFLLREPYDEQNPLQSFQYYEGIDTRESQLLWTSSVYALADRLCESFVRDGWCVNIRGPQSGGKVDALPRHLYFDGCCWQSQVPLEVMVSETQELQLAELGFVCLSYYKNRDYACFFSANSIQRPQTQSDAIMNANLRINARLPYVFLCSRLAHYLKVHQRETIGSNKTKVQLESDLNHWLQSLVTTMQQPSAELAAKHPLREAFVEVKDIPATPGLYRVNLFVKPHFQIEGMDVRLALVSQLPGVVASK